MNKPLWKVNQEIYHKLTASFSDDASQFTTIESPDIVTSALWYFGRPDPNLAIYPAKSYVVALVFARLLELHFEESFYDVLNDPELLYGSDPHFVPYGDDKETYDAILTFLGGPENIPLKGPLIDHTVHYFKEECLGEAECFST